MIKRTVYFGNPVYLSLRNAQMHVRLPEMIRNEFLHAEHQTNAVASIPVEDLGLIVLDHKQITITQALLEALMQNNTLVVTCDSTHHPTGMLLPLCGNTIQQERFLAQISASEPLKKQLWAQTISQKIKNQYAVLQKRGLNASYLVPLYRNVKSGDADNCEATAAAFYWKTCYREIECFRRFREGAAPNNYLNYAYALLRATMARSLVGAGLLPTLGIHHSNRYNAFCLADDIMEPYRPIVDEVVYKVILEYGLQENLSKSIKAELLVIPGMDVMIDGEKSPLMNATQRTAVSLVRCFAGLQKKILYPELAK